MTEQACSTEQDRNSVVVKVLYIEDNDADVYMLKMRLELLGTFAVLTAEDGEKGSEMAAAERPDIILMDLEMPVVDGWEAAWRLKGNPQTRDIPIIVLSAHALAGEREKAIAAGCEEFDTKPIEFERLVATVRRVLDGRKCATRESRRHGSARKCRRAASGGRSPRRKDPPTLVHQIRRAVRCGGLYRASVKRRFRRLLLLSGAQSVPHPHPTRAGGSRRRQDRPVHQG